MLTIRKTTFFKLVINIDNIKQQQFIQLKIFAFIAKKIEIFDKLQNVFVDFTFLIYFDLNRRLYVNLNVFKRWEFVVIIYYVIENSLKSVVSSRTNVQFFFQQIVKWNKKNYWFIELKIIKIVWIIKRIRHIIKFTKLLSTIIYINYSTIVFIFKQTILITNNTNKLNL